MRDIKSLEALADPTRRKLFEQLRDGPRSVSELVQAVAKTQPAVSQHLKVLKAARLVQVRKQGQMRIYSMDRAGLAELRAYVESLWDDVLDAYAAAAAEEASQTAAAPTHEDQEELPDV